MVFAAQRWLRVRALVYVSPSFLEAWGVRSVWLVGWLVRRRGIDGGREGGREEDVPVTAMVGGCIPSGILYGG